MASRKRQRSFLASLRNSSQKAASRDARRRNLVEKLEQRQLLAGPQLIGIQPDEGSLIIDGTVRDVSPRLLTFRFDEDQVIHPSTTDAIRVTRAGGDGVFGDANDEVVELPEGSVTVNSSAPNEVLVRFPGALPDDDYRIEVFAFDDADAGIVGLRNTDASGAPGELLVPSTAGTRKEQVDFELQLGALVESVVPQPVVRLADGTLTQRRDQIVVYFNEDELFVEDYPAGHALAGSPTERSAENPRFYQLLYTRDTVRTTDDDLYLPTNVDYDAATNTATLTFADDISNLAGAANVTEGAASISGGTFRLRVGTAVDNRAELVVTPTNIDVVASVTSDLRTGGAATVTFRARAAGEAGNGISVRFERTAAVAPTARVENDREVVIDLGSGPTTVGDVRDAMLASPEANALLEVVISDVGAAGSLVGAGMEFAPPLQVVAAGDTLQSAFDVGVLGQGAATLTSLVIAGEIEPQPYLLELPGGNDDPGHRELDESAGDEFVQHLSELFSPDVTDGVTTIPYNFQRVYGLDTNGASLINGLNDPSDGALQRERIREALGLWASQLGVQFTETADQGITFVLGDTSALPNFADVDDTKLVLLGSLDFAARVDPTFDSSMLIMDADRNWETLYGQDFLRTATAAIGVLLGLEEAAELPTSTLMNLSTAMLSGSDASTSPEPVFPGNYDVLHGQYLYNPDSNDVDLYRFQVELGDDDKVGLLTAETFAERLADSSLLDSTLTLYQQLQASAVTDFAVGTDLSVQFEAVAPGRLGNRTQISFVEVTRLAGDTTVTVVPTSENSFRVEIPRQNANTGLPVVTVGSVLDAINNDPFASTLVQGTILKGDASMDIGGTNLSYSPLVLMGGEVVELSRNDDYFSEDSLIRANLGNGVYYIGVAASGNDSYDPTITQSGFGGRTQGEYELQLVFEAQVDEVDVIRDLDGDREGVPGTRLDGNADGVPGDAYNYWFQSRPLQRQIEFTALGDGITPFSTIQVVGGNGNERTFQFVPQGSTGDSRFVSVIYNPTDTPTALALKLSQAINSETGALEVSTTANGTVLTFGQTNLAGQLVRMERAVEFSSDFAGAQVHGRTIFVDKSAGPDADGTVLRPFDNISNSDVPNAFDAAQPGDIVRIVGNGGSDGLLATEVDNVPYEFGPGLAPGEVLDDGLSMKVPQGVTTMIDAGAVLRFRNSLVSVGSSDLLVDRSGGSLQVLGTPRLLDANGNLLSDDGSVIFTSTRDRTAGQALTATQPAVSSGDWGGIVFRSDFDDAQGRLNLEDEGIFLQYVNHADIRYGGSSNVKVDGNQELINSVQIIDMRPTITFNTISNADAAAMSAAPNSFEETNYQAPRFQQAGAFTSDYDRVGPDIHRNTLVNNSLNGLFVRVDTLAGEAPRELSLAGRFDDVDIVHIMSENLIVTGTPGGPITDDVQPSVNLVNGEGRIGGTLAPGDYEYRMTFVDANGFESLASDATAALTVGAGENAIQLANLPQVTSGYQYRRIYRAATTGPNAGEFFLVDELDASSTSYFDTGRTTEGLLDLTRVGTRGRLDASLVFDPGLVTKLFGSRIELGQGTQLLAEGLPGQEVVFTSILDDRYGSGGAFDTNNDDSSESPVAGNWGGIYVSPTAHVSLDNSVVAYGGGLTRVGGTFKAFSALEIQQGTARVTDSVFENNANGQGGQGPTGRFGRLANTPSTIFVRGSQPTIVGNTFIDNSGSVIDIDVNSFTGDLNPDKGRQTGSIDRLSALDDNYGPLVRRNRLDNNGVNGMEIRTTTLTTESIWDDTDIVHVVFGEVTTENLHSSGGLRLQSRADESLVVKFQGSGSPYSAEAGAGLTAEGTPSSIEDRVGGTLQILGQPGFPVVLTSFLDDTVGAGVKPDGSPQTDTNNDDLASRPEPNDWRGILLDEYSNDNNVETILETESTTVEAPGINGTVNSAQVLGDLAANVYSTDELLRLGFTVHGYLSNPTDVDVYNFTGEAGTMVWFDIDKTTFSLDTVIELLDSNGNVLVRSDNSTGEVFDPEGILVSSPLVEDRVGSLLRGNEEFAEFGAEGLYEDYGTINMRDAGFRVALPGASGSRSSYSFRVRSASVDPDDAAGGTTRGAYSVQLRLQEAQEFGGSVVRYADIRYANNGVHARGLMVNSPLLGDAQENEQISFASSNNSLEWDLNQTGSRPQYLGNLLATDDASISVGGALSFSGDVDFYKFEIDHTQLPDEFDPLQHFSTVFDIDYADGLSRPDTSLAVFWDPTGEADSSDARLVLWSQDGNIAEDQTSPLGPETGELFERGSQAPGDPFIGPVAVPASGVYYVAVVSDAAQPAALTSNTFVRLDPLPSVARVADDQLETIGINTADAPAVPVLIPRTGLPANWTIDNQRSFSGGHGQPLYFDNTAYAPDFFNNESLHYTPLSTAASQFETNQFNLGGYTALDEPYLYFNYYQETGASLQVNAVQADGSLVALPFTFLDNAFGSFRQARISLEALAGQDNLRLQFVASGTPSGTPAISLDDFVIGFAERGERVGNADQGVTTFVGVASDSPTLSGEYQLEIRPGAVYSTSQNDMPQQILTDTFDTNDRLAAETVTLIAPAGSQLSDGDFFELSDGANTVRFEFNSTGSVQLGSFAVPFSSTDTDYEIAEAIRAVINDPNIQDLLNVEASSSGGIDIGPSLDNRIDLVGPVEGDFIGISLDPVEVTPEIDADVLVDQVVGDGIVLTGASTAIGDDGLGMFTGGEYVLGLEEGVLLSTGNVLDGQGPNFWENSTGTASGSGDADLDAATGVTSTDSASLEFDFEIDADSPSHIYMQAVFASEEYRNDAGPVVNKVAVLLEDVNAGVVYNLALTPAGAQVDSTAIAPGSPLYIDNSPTLGGEYLRQLGYDGFTQVLSFSSENTDVGALQLQPGDPYRLKFVVGDSTAGAVDSALFIGAHSLSTTAPPAAQVPVDPATGRVTFQALLRDTLGDRNVSRRQSQLIIDSSKISHVQAYGIWSEPAERKTDPIDTFYGNPYIQDIQLGNTGSGAVRNLPALNDSVTGGLAAGIHIVNNIIDDAQLAGINIQGELQPFIINPDSSIPDPDTHLPNRAAGDLHIGDFVRDGATMTITSGNHTVTFEFEEIHALNGYNVSNIPIYYRSDLGARDGRGYGYNKHEWLLAIREAILSSSLVQNDMSQLVNPVIGNNILISDEEDYTDPNGGTLFREPALYIYGASSVSFSPGVPASISRAPVHEGVQPFARIVNNTIVGRDGTYSQATDNAISSVPLYEPSAPANVFETFNRPSEPNDTISTAVDTRMGVSHAPELYRVRTTLGDSINVAPSQDVDFYQVNLDVGERLYVDVDTDGSVDTSLRLFNSAGQIVTFYNAAGQAETVNQSGTDAGETAGVDPFLDYTATAQDTYYVAVSADGNESYDGLSLGQRLDGSSTGEYEMSIEVAAPRQFVITALDGSSYSNGQQFTVWQIPDRPGMSTSAVTFEFTTGGGVTAGNVPINFNTNFNRADMAQVIAAAIDSASVPGIGSALQNYATSLTRLPDGRFGPIDAVEAAAFGGAQSGGGLTLLAGRPHHANNPVGTDSPNGYGYNDSTTSQGGNAEKYVLVSRAAKIEGNISVSPANSSSNIDQIVSEMGVLATHGASPTLLNNVFINLNQGVFREGSYKGGEVIVGGSLFQGVRGATNVGGANDNFNEVVPFGDELLEDPLGDDFLPVFGTAAVDSAVDSLDERGAFSTFKGKLGITVSPVLAPDRDNSGQLRADGSGSQSGVGGNVFKDRGALDLADFVGPVALADLPADNDAEGIDTDPTVSFLQLSDGSYGEFRIQLIDTGDASDPFPGSGIDDDTVVGAEVTGLRKEGATLTLFENGNLLTEGIDYKFVYDSTKNQIRLTPLAGVWRNDRSYRIQLNNTDRFVVIAPSAATISDGDQLQITDENGGVVSLEFEAGYEIEVPEILTLIVPQAGTGAGGIRDSERFTIDDGVNAPVTFEFDLVSENNTLPGSVRIPFAVGDTPAELATAIGNVVAAQAGLDIDVVVDGTSVQIGAESGATLDAFDSGLLQAAKTLALQPPLVGAGPGGIQDGETFTINDGTQIVTFEFETGGGVGATNVPVPVAGATTDTLVSEAMRQAIAGTNLNIVPTVIGGRLLLDLPVDGSATAGTGLLRVVGLAQTPDDGTTLTFTPTNGDPDVVFELNRSEAALNDGVVTPGAIGIDFTRATTADQLAELIADAIKAETIAGVDPNVVDAIGNGVVSVVGDPGLGLTTLGSSSVLVTGEPGVAGFSNLQVFGALEMLLPSLGGISIANNSQFSLTGNDQTVFFEYTQNGFTNNPAAIPILYSINDAVDVIVAATVNAINGQPLGITATTDPLSPESIFLGQIDNAQVDLLDSGFATQRGTVSDGDYVVISQGTTSAVYEFNLAVGGGGLTQPGAVAVTFEAGSDTDVVASALAAAIRNNKNGLRLDPVAEGDSVLLNDVPGTNVDVSNTPTLLLSGVPGQATPIMVNRSFTSVQIKEAIIDAINRINDSVPAGDPPFTNIVAVDRGGDTLFVENAQSIGSQVQNYYLQSIADEAGQHLKPNRPDNTTQFTFLMPDVSLDFGDAPDPVNAVRGRYPTLFDVNGARHVIGLGPVLGSLVDGDANGQPTTPADGDDTAIDVVANTGTTFTVTPQSGSLEITLGALVDGDTLTLDTGIARATFEIDTDGIFEEDNFAVALQTGETAGEALQRAFLESPLRPANLVVNGDALQVVVDDEDGVSFASENNPEGVFNNSPGFSTPISVTVTGTGVVDAWIDFNGDGDWSDPGEKIIGRGIDTVDSQGVSASPLFVEQTDDQGNPVAVTREFAITIPSNTSVPLGPLTTYARFRLSAEGDLSPTGLALSGEVEDYAVRVLPGQPPAVPADYELSYDLLEDTRFDAFDADGSVAPADNDGVLALITDPDGDAVAVFAGDVGTRRVENEAGEGGTLVMNADGTFSFEPDLDFAGTLTFNLRVTDVRPVGQEDEQLVSPNLIKVTLNVATDNDPPRPANGTPVSTTVALAEDTVRDFTVAELTDGLFDPGPANESDQALIIESVGWPSGSGTVPFTTERGGSLEILGNGTIVRYTPPLNLNGVADRFIYKVEDVPTGVGELPAIGAEPGTVVINLSAVNDPPIAADDDYQATEDDAGGLQIPITGVNGILNNDASGPADEQAADPSVFLIETDFDGGITTQRGGTVTYVPAAGTTDAYLLYEPATNFSGDDSFTYRIRDAAGLIASGTVNVEVVGNNDPADFIGIEGVPGDDTEDFEESKQVPRVVNYDLNTWFNDPEGDALTFNVTVDDPSLVQIQQSGPNLGQLQLTFPSYASGTATLTVEASNVPFSPSTTTSQDITINLLDTPDLPRVIGTLNELTVQEDGDNGVDGLVVRDLSTVFEDPDNDQLSYRVISPTSFANSPLVESVTFVGDQIRIQLREHANGSVNITIGATDDASDLTREVTDSFTLNVTPVADVPAGVEDFYNVSLGGLLSVQDVQQGVRNNDFDPDGNDEDLVLELVSTTTKGTLTLNDDGTFVYQNESGEIGETDQFTYRLTNTAGSTAPIPVTINLGRSAYQNPIPGKNFDVTADGFVAPDDVLQVINLLNRRGVTPVSALTDPPPPYYDVDGNGVIEPFDAVLVINELNLRNRQGTGGQGESANARLATTSAFAAIDTSNLPQSNQVAVSDEESLESSPQGETGQEAGLWQAGFVAVDNRVDAAVETLDSSSRADTDAAAQEMATDSALSSLIDEISVDIPQS